MEHKQKIFYVITKSNWGGAGKYVVELAKFMHATGSYDVAVVCGENEFGGKNVFKEALADAGIRIIDMPHWRRDISILKEFRAAWDLFKIFWFERPDIIHLNSSKAGGVGGVIGRITGVRRIVYTAHGLPFLEDRPWWQKFIIAFLTYVTFFLMHVVIVLSDEEKSRVKHWLGVRHKVTRIYIGVRPVHFLPRDEARAQIRDQYKVPMESRIVIGSIAELTKNKGLKYLIEALVQLERDGYDFTFVNFGEGELRDELKALVTEYNLEGRIFFLGFVQNAKTSLKALDVFILPSVKEGLPYTVLEAGLAQLPVVATNVGGVPEILAGGTKGILVEPKDSVALRNALEKLLEDAELCRAHAAALLQHVTKTFSFETMVAATTAVYERS